MKTVLLSGIVSLVLLASAGPGFAQSRYYTGYGQAGGYGGYGYGYGFGSPHVPVSLYTAPPFAYNGTSPVLYGAVPYGGYGPMQPWNNGGYYNTYPGYVQPYGGGLSYPPGRYGNR